MIGVSPSTMANAESGPYAILGVKRVEALADALKLDDGSRARLLELHAACPMSEFQIKRAERWAKHRAEREVLKDAKALAAELALLRDQASRSIAIRSALIRLLDRDSLAGAACECSAVADEVGYACDLCNAMRALGIPAGWVDSDAATRALDAAFPNENEVGDESVPADPEFG